MTKREKLVSWLQDNGRWPAGTTITCDECEGSDNCRWAYDPYNTDGNCLGDK